MCAMATLRRGRPSRPVLSVAGIHAAALELVDEQGAPALTMNRLAERLGVQAASLYHHVADKAAVWEGIRHLVVTEMTWTVFVDQPWDVAVGVWARSYRAAFIRHVNTVPVLFTAPVAEPLTYEMYQAVCQGLADGGWPEESLAEVLSTVEYLIAGSVLDHEALGEMFGRAAELGAPLLAASIRSRSQVAVADRAFDLAIEGLLIGLRAELVRRSA
jgi:AcrR family transcriptional regulator